MGATVRSDALDSLVERLKAEWPDIRVSGTVVSGHPVTATAEAVAAVGASIVVMGNHHHSTLVSVVTDSVLRHLPSHVTCPVAASPVAPIEC
ncbi:MAG: universal stress protein [Acidimicrobiales bacterium]